MNITGPGLYVLTAPPTPAQLSDAYHRASAFPAVKERGVWKDLRTADGQNLTVAEITAIYVPRSGECPVTGARRAEAILETPPAEAAPSASAPLVSHAGYLLRRLLAVACLFALIHAYIFGSTTVAAHALSAAYLLNRQAVALFPTFPDFTRRTASVALPEAAAP